MKPETTRVTARPSPPLFSFQKQLPPPLFKKKKKKISKVAFLKFPKMDFCFSCRAYTFISTDNELRNILSLEF